MRDSLEARSTLAAVAFFSLVCACMPLRDLDKAVGGRSGTSADAAAGSMTIEGGTTAASGGAGGMSSSSGASGGLTAGSESSNPSTNQGGTTNGGSMVAGGTVSSGRSTGGTGGRTIPTRLGGAGSRSSSAGSGGTTARFTSTGGGGTGPRGGTGGTTDSGSTGGATRTAAPDLPDIVNSPVQGQITYSAGASWDIDGEQWPAFEIHTPTANYWLVKSAAAIVSITDTAGVQWINFSSGFRPNRGVPNLGGCCQPGNPETLGLPLMTTELDPSFTITSTHLRLISKSDTESYWLVWDFFLSHFTLTVNRAEKPFGFTFRGVPGGAIDAADQLVLSSGETLSPKDPYVGTLSGQADWVYYDHTLGKHSLFLIQHTGDALADSYQIADGDTAMWTFGGDQSKRYLTQTPMRFSLGLVDSAEDAVVSERIRFVISAIR